MSSDKRDRLKVVLAAYGADPARWPDAERADLAALLADDGAAPHEERRQAREIDQVLAAASAPALPAGAHARLLDAAHATPQTVLSDDNPEPLPLFGIGRFAAMSTLAASLLVGVTIGTFGNLDPDIWNGGTAFIVSDDDGFEDPFDLDSLVSDIGEETG